MKESESKTILQRIAKMYRPNAKFSLEFVDPNDDLDVIKGLSIKATDDSYQEYYANGYADIAYSTFLSGRPQVIMIGRPHTCKHALETLLWCLKRRDVGIWMRFGNDSKWTKLFKQGTTLDELLITLDLSTSN